MKTEAEVRALLKEALAYLDYHRRRGKAGMLEALAARIRVEALRDVLGEP